MDGCGRLYTVIFLWAHESCSYLIKCSSSCTPASAIATRDYGLDDLSQTGYRFSRGGNIVGIICFRRCPFLKNKRMLPEQNIINMLRNSLIFNQPYHSWMVLDSLKESEDIADRVWRGYLTSFGSRNGTNDDLSSLSQSVSLWHILWRDGAHHDRSFLCF